MEAVRVVIMMMKTVTMLSTSCGSCQLPPRPCAAVLRTLVSQRQS